MGRFTLFLAVGFFTVSALCITSCDQEALNEIIGPGLTEEEVIQGLRTALTVGTDTSVTKLSKPDGYYGDQFVRILLPPEIATVENILVNNLGLGAEVENFKISLNRAAEDAASEAKPVFVNAITGITIGDAFGILRGSDSSATIFLKDRTFDSLSARFSPIIGVSLNKPLVLGVSTNQYWNNIVVPYNDFAGTIAGQLLGLNPVNADLGQYVTEKALTGLFVKVQDEEKKIRTNPLHRVSEILKKVFGSR